MEIILSIRRSGMRMAMQKSLGGRAQFPSSCVVGVESPSMIYDDESNLISDL